MIRSVATLGEYTLASLREMGRISIFAARGVVSCFFPPFFPGEILKQLLAVGFYSLPIVGLTALFAGMVLALQMHVGFARFNAEGAVASVVVIGITRELGPVFAGLMVAGRLGSSIAAEIGSMKVSEQIDALGTLLVDPLKFLVVPRIIAGVIMLPFLVLIADIIGVMGGFLVSITVLNFSSGTYLLQTVQSLQAIDVISGLVKASAFGFCITTFGCYHGFSSDLGARGVGRATTSSVVSSCIGVLVFNYLLTALFFGT
ncbi:MAG: ABC transporter permease [Holosporaceae bacterium]|jgi:phospholipid/cholesterol/gamma-HCH transport system permease protein|nr:ABC transporter permease [Holosporaceae bacterium]